MSDAEEPPVQERLMSERYLDPKRWAWGSTAIGAGVLVALTVFVLFARGLGTATIVFAAVAGFAVFFVLISDTWDLLTRRSNFHWAYAVWVLIAAALLGILIVVGVAFALLVPGVALLIFGTLKLFGSF